MTLVQRGTWLLVVKGRDTWSDSRLDTLEREVKGRILTSQDDGCGAMLLTIMPTVKPDAKERKRILDTIPSSRWVQA